jgi:tetratricopeptide (TPR) repeat protein
VGVEQSLEGQRLLALAEMRRANHPAAIAAIDAAIQLETDSPADLMRVKAAIHQGAGDWQQVFVTLQRLSRQPGVVVQPADQLLYARALYETGRAQLGRANLETLLAQESPPPGAFLEYANREGRNDPERAREYLERVLEKAPRQPAALQSLVALLANQEKTDEALAVLDRAAQSGPLPPSVLLLRAQLFAAKQDWARAEEEARRAFASAPNLRGALDLLARIYAAQNRLDEAIASFEEAEKVGALPPSGQALLARLHLAKGNRDAAKPLYEKALAQRSDLPGAKNDLAWLLAEQGLDLDRALTLAQEAQQAEPENPDFVDTLGYVYFRKGLHEPALQQFQYALELVDRARESRPEFQYHLGLALRALGRPGDAAAAFERALAIDANFPHAEDARRELEAARSSLASQPG